MARKPSYEELEQRVKELEQEAKELKQAEDAQRETHEYLENLINYANAPIIVWDPGFRITRFNHAFERLTGYKANEVIDQELNILFTEASRDESLSKIELTLSGEYWESVEIPILCKDGDILVALWNSANIYAEDGKTIVATIAQGQDITERKQMEEKLKETEEKYLALVESSSDAVLLMDRERKIVFCDQAFFDLFGYERNEVEGRSIRIIHQSDDSFRSFGKKAYPTIEKTGSFRTEWEFMRKNGTITPVETVTSVIKSHDGSITGYIAIIRDITERKQAEETLRESEEKYRTLVEESFDGIFVQKGPEIIFANQRLHEMLGYEEGELLGLDHWLVYHPDYQELTRERAQARMRGEIITSQYEVKLQRKDGSWFYGEINARAISFNGEPGVQVWVKDITERKRAEETLRESEERFRDISYSMADWIWEVDNNGRYTFASGKVKEILGYNPEELIGKTPFELMPEDEQKRIGEAFKRIASEKKPIVDLENWNLTKEGREVCLLTNGVPILGESGELIGYRGVDKNITQQKLAEEKLLKKAKELESFNKLAVDREFKVIELKKEINALLEESGKESRYKIVNADI